MAEKDGKGAGFFGFAAVALIVTGIAGIVHAFYFGDGIGILGSAVAFSALYYSMARVLK